MAASKQVKAWSSSCFLKASRPCSKSPPRASNGRSRTKAQIGQNLVIDSLRDCAEKAAPLPLAWSARHRKDFARRRSRGALLCSSKLLKQSRLLSHVHYCSIRKVLLRPGSSKSNPLPDFRRSGKLAAMQSGFSRTDSALRSAACLQTWQRPGSASPSELVQPPCRRWVALRQGGCKGASFARTGPGKGLPASAPDSHLLMRPG